MRAARPVRQRLIVPVAALAIVTASLAAQSGTSPQQPQSPERPPVFRGGANFVLVDVYPQREGRIVEGLTAADFAVLEDGKPQAIESFEFVRVPLAPRDIVRRDPGSLREMYALAADPHNRVFAIFLDTRHTTVEGSQRLHRPLVDTLDRHINPDDLYGVMTEDMRPEDLTLGRKVQTVDEQLSKYWTWGQRQRIGTTNTDPTEFLLTACLHQRMTPTGEVVDWIVDDGPVRRYFDEIMIERLREDRTLTSLERLIEYAGRLRDARTVLIIVTDGWLLPPRNEALVNETSRDERLKGGVLPPSPQTVLGRGRSGDRVDVTAAQCLSEVNRLASLDADRRFRDLMALANRTNVAVYPISAGGLAVFDSSLAERTTLNANADPRAGTALGRDVARQRDRLENLKTLAENTGGLSITGSNDIAGGLNRIFEDVSAYYLLGYYSTNTRMDGRLRKIDVRMRPPGLTTRARAGYVAPRSTGAAPDLAAAAALGAGAARVEGALAALSQIRADRDLFLHGTVVQEELALSVELASRHVSSGGAFAGGGPVSVEVAGNGSSPTATSAIASGARSTLVRVPVSGTGPWLVRVRVGAGSAAFEERLQVMASTARVLGDPLVFRATPSPRSVPLPVADFQFRRTERLHVEFPRLESTQMVQARLLDRRGQPLAVTPTTAERALPASLAILVDLNLAPLAEGDYVLEVTTNGPDQTAFLAFRVVR